LALRNPASASVPSSFPVSGAARKTVSILGSTGSIGCSTLDLIARDPSRFELVALTAHRNVDGLIEQARRLRPQLAVISDDSLYGRLAEGLKGIGVEAAAGPQAVIEAAARPAQWVMAGIVGAAGLAPTLAAVARGACVALANKECLVSAGNLFMEEVRRAGATLLPVDSEHNAIFQVLNLEHLDAVDRITLTASGGPFRQWSLEQMAAATPAQACAHPRWEMGAKISVDSATLMNKGLELIEAFHLFPVSEKQLEVIVHPESIVHSMVGYVDGSVLAQLGSPDMRTPISYALAWPARMATPATRLDFTQLGKLSFEEPDLIRFPSLSLARQALVMGEAAPTVLNAANEVAVAAFLAGRIGFLQIAQVVEDVLTSSVASGSAPGRIEDVYEIDRISRLFAAERVQFMSR